MKLITRNMQATILTLVAALAFASPAFAAPPSDRWETDLETAKKTARSQDKPILVMLSADWCPPCKMMKQQVLPEQPVQEALDLYVPLYLDVDHNKAASQFNTNSIPTFVILGPEGDEYGRMAGAIGDPEQFVDAMGQIVGYKRELEKIEASIEQNPESAQLWKEKGDLMADHGDVKKGVEAYKKAQQLDPDNETGVAADLYLFESLILLNENPGEGEQRLEQMDRKFPDSPRLEDAAYLLALIPLQDRNIELARQRLESYLDKYPEGKFSEVARQWLEQLETRS